MQDVVEDTGQLKSSATKGAIWITAVAILALPLAYYRSWILAQFGSDGAVIGAFALILLFIEVVSGCALLGGNGVITNYMPKVSARAARSSFLLSYLSVVFGAGLVFSITLLVWPELLYLIADQVMPADIVSGFALLALIVVISQTTLFGLNGTMQFGLWALLSQLQLLTVATFSTVAYFYFRDYFEGNAIGLLCAVIATAHIVVAVIGGTRIFRVLGKPSTFPFYPRGFWPFAWHMHGNVLCTIIFASMDRLFVVSWLGVSQLGMYYILLQLAELVRFIPNKIGQLLLVSFSSLIASGNTAELVSVYLKLCKMTMAISAGCAIGLILFSAPLTALFGDWAAENHRYLILLAAITNIGNVGTVNAMLVLAREKSGVYLLNSGVQIMLQFGVTLFFLKDYGIGAVILGKGVGILAAQLGLFYIIRERLSDLGLTRVPHYWTGQTLVLLTAWWAYDADGLPIALAALAFIIILPLYFLLIRFNPLEFKRLLLAGLR